VICNNLLRIKMRKIYKAACKTRIRLTRRQDKSKIRMKNSPISSKRTRTSTRLLRMSARIIGDLIMKTSGLIMSNIKCSKSIMIMIDAVGNIDQTTMATARTDGVTITTL